MAAAPVDALAHRSRDTEARRGDCPGPWTSSWVEFQVDARINKALRDVAEGGVSTLPKSPRTGISACRSSECWRDLTEKGVRHGAGRMTRDLAENDMPSELRRMADAHAGLLRVVEALVGEVSRLTAADKPADSTISAAAKVEVAKIETSINDLREMHRSLRNEVTQHEDSIKRLRRQYSEQVDGELLPVVKKLELKLQMLDGYKARDIQGGEESTRARGDSFLRSQGDAGTALRIETAHKALASRHATTAERVDYLEKILGDACTTQEKEVAAIHAELKTFHDRLISEERNGREVRLLNELQAHHSSVQDRLRYLEGQMGDTEEKHVRGFKSMEAQHSSLQDRVEHIERSVGASMDLHSRELETQLDSLRFMHTEQIDAVRDEHAKQAADIEGNQAHLANMAERFDSLETTLCDLVGRQAKDSEFALQAHHGLANDAATLADLSAVLKDRLNRLEGNVEASIEASVGELRSTCVVLDQRSETTASGLRDLRGQVDELNSQQSIVEESNTRHRRELESLKRTVSEQESQLQAQQERSTDLETGFDDAFKKYAKELESLKASTVRLSKELETAKGCEDAHHGSLKRSLTELDNVLGGSVERHSRELDVLKDTQAKHANQLESTQRSHKVLQEDCVTIQSQQGGFLDRHDRLEAKLAKEMETNQQAAHKIAEERHATMQRLGFLEARLGDSAEQHFHLPEMSDVPASQRGFSARHESVVRRLDCIEKLLGESTGKHAKEMHVVHKKIADCSDGSDSLNDRIDRLDSTWQERMDYIDKILADSNRHWKDLEALKAQHAKVSAKHAEELVALKQAQLKMSSKMSLDAANASLATRIDNLENSAGDLTEKHTRHAKELQTLKVSHTSFVRDVEQALNENSGNGRLRADIAALAERLVEIEESSGQEKRGKDIESLKLASAKHDRELDAIRGAHAALSRDLKTALEDVRAREAHNSRVNGKLCDLEQELKVNQDELRQDVEAWRNAMEKDLKGMQRRIASDLKVEMRGGVDTREYRRSSPSLETAQKEQERPRQSVNNRHAVRSRSLDADLAASASPLPSPRLRGVIGGAGIVSLAHEALAGSSSSPRGPKATVSTSAASPQVSERTWELSPRLITGRVALSMTSLAAETFAEHGTPSPAKWSLDKDDHDYSDVVRSPIVLRRGAALGLASAAMAEARAAANRTKTNLSSSAKARNDSVGSNGKATRAAKGRSLRNDDSPEEKVRTSRFGWRSLASPS